MDDSPHITDWITAFGTAGAVIIALFGPKIVGVFPPRLRVSIHKRHGEFQHVEMHAPDGGVRVAKARYYHARVRNTRRRWSPAANVQLCLLRVEVPSAAGFTTTWQGDGLPLVWQHQQAQSVRPTVGPDVNADLFHIVEGKWLELTTLIAPVGLVRRYTEKCELRLWVQARSDEADSPVVGFHVKWDGTWHDGEREMADRLVVTELNLDAQQTAVTTAIRAP